MSAKPTFPIVKRSGSTAVKIYRQQTRTCVVYTVTWFAGRGRQRKSFKDQQEAISFAGDKAKELNEGDRTAVDRDTFNTFMRVTKQLELYGLTVEQAVAEFLAAKKISRDVDLVIPVQEHYARNRQSAVKPVTEAVTEFLASKSGEVSRKYHVAVSNTLAKIREIGFLADIDTDIIQKILDGMVNTRTKEPLSKEARHGCYRHFKAFFKWCQDKQFLPMDWAEVRGVNVATPQTQKPDPYPAEEIGKILKTADPSVIPFIAIRSFAGVRDAELKRLTWAALHVDGEERNLIIEATDSKTGKRRMVPVSANLWEWIKPYRDGASKIAPTDVDRLVIKALLDAKVKTRRNGMRKSFISARIAETDNVAKTSLEAGNTPEVCEEYYKGLFTKTEAKRYFSIKP